MTRRLAWLVLGAILCTTVVLAMWLPRLVIDSSMESFYVRNNPDFDAYEAHRAEFEDDEIVVVGVKPLQGDAFSPREMQRVARITESIERLPSELGVDRVVSLTTVDDVRASADGISARRLVSTLPRSEAESAQIRAHTYENPLFVHNLVSADGSCSAITVTLRHRPGDRKFKGRLVAAIMGIVKEQCSGAECHVAGIPVLMAHSATLIYRDMLTLVPVTIAVMALVLWLAFRTVAAVVVPLTLVGISVMWTLSLAAAMGQPMTILSSIVPSLLLAVGIAYTVHVLVAFYEGADADSPVRVSRAVRQVGAAVALSGFTTAVGFGSLIVNEVPQVRHFGLYSAIGVGGATLLALGGLAAALCLHPRCVAAKRSSDGIDAAVQRALSSCTRAVRRFARPIAVVGIVVLGLMVWRGTQVHVDTDFANFFEPDSVPRRAVTFVGDNLAGERPLSVVLTTSHRELDGVYDPAVLHKVEEVEQLLATHPRVAATISLAAYLRRMNQVFHDNDPSEWRIPPTRQHVAQYLLAYSRPRELARYLSSDGNSTVIVARSSIISSGEFLSFTHRLQESLRDVASAASPEVSFRLTGSMYLLARASQAISTGMAKSLAIATGVVFVLMLVAFRSWKLAIVGLVANVFPVAAYFALLEVSGITLNTGTSVAATVVLGIAVDDTMHFLSRYRRARAETAVECAVQRTMHGTGRALLFTTAANAAGFAVLSLSSFVPLAQLGWLSATTMIIALLADVVLVPALLLVFDRGPAGIGSGAVAAL